jgi:hypothetical protein
MGVPMRVVKTKPESLRPVSDLSIGILRGREPPHGGYAWSGQTDDAFELVGLDRA